jgi:hypothetical protein
VLRSIGFMCRSSQRVATNSRVLNACEGARSDANDPFGGCPEPDPVAPYPRWWPMQFEITDAAAIIPSSELYGVVADGCPVDAAVAEPAG